MDDDLVCEYDSTWDTESDGDELENTGRNKKTRPAFWSNSSSRNLRAAKDMQNYRHGYPNINEEECPEERMINLKFYLNEIKSSPDDVSIETFHTEWKTDYKRLERVHSYIQWLFPLREPGVNYMAAELTKKEIQAFRENEEAKSRLVDSYELMLGFYGIHLLNRETGEVKRAENWRERFANLERNMHNNLRITRILKSLGELGFEHFQAPLVRFFLEETLVKKTLSSVKRSVLDYFLFAVRDKRERRKLVRFAFQHFEPKDKFVWCPRKIQKRFKKKSEKRQNSIVPNGESLTNDEAHVQHKTTVEQKCIPADVIETMKHVEDDSGMNVDSEKQSEYTFEDLEKTDLDGSSVDLPLNNETNMDNGEIDHSKPSSIEDQCCADSKIELTEVTEAPKQILRLESDQEASKTKWECVAGSSTGSVECIESQDEMGSWICPTPCQLDQKELHEVASGTNKESTVTDSPENIPRPDLKNRSGGPAQKETSAEIMNVRSGKSCEYNNINCNQSHVPDKDEPMDMLEFRPHSE
ncbi:opioid growth factor receptor [Triplophysa dalaica]|uniref:opioid growth factor receptor n=1 Tax=Triplophysa dalaica TaxID=1582913 RepID=UPI0024E03944|nr:opioid growth factor receptor [Triplophysa dalaica]